MQYTIIMVFFFVKTEPTKDSYKKGVYKCIISPIKDLVLFIINKEQWFYFDTWPKGKEGRRKGVSIYNWWFKLLLMYCTHERKTILILISWQRRKKQIRCVHNKANCCDLSFCSCTHERKNDFMLISWWRRKKPIRCVHNKANCCDLSFHSCSHKRKKMILILIPHDKGERSRKGANTKRRIAVI